MNWSFAQVSDDMKVWEFKKGLRTVAASHIPAYARLRLIYGQSIYLTLSN